MTKRSALLDRLPQHEAFTTAQAADLGIDSRSLYRLRDAGSIERIGWGLYIAGDAPEANIDYLEAASKAQMATICLSSALAHHGLIDEIPSTTDLALPRGKTPPHLSAASTWHIFDKATFDIGRSTIPIEGSNLEIGIYSPERSIIDAFRLRGRTGYETATEALRNWLGSRGSQPAKLMQIASAVPRARGPLRQALEILL
jgi:predicted transcriptional regulator of viral defense system